jgi:hypothetical protein
MFENDHGEVNLEFCQKMFLKRDEMNCWDWKLRIVKFCAARRLNLHDVFVSCGVVMAIAGNGESRRLSRHASGLIRE